MASCTEFPGGAAAALERMNASLSYVSHSNIRLTSLIPGHAEGEVAVGPENFGLGETIHGGCLMTLADTVAGAAAMSQGGICVTLDTSFHFLRPATAPTIRCKAAVRKSGRTIRVADVSLSDAAGQEVACGTFTFYVKEGSFDGSLGQ